MTSQNILELITKLNLSVRRIPDQITEVNEIRHRRDGDEVFTSLPSPHFPNGRQFVRRVRIPEHAGWFMVKPVNDTGSIVRWNAKEDNLAPTLEESVALFLGSTNLEKACQLLGWQGGTIHQVAETTGLPVQQLLESKDIETLLQSVMN